MARTDSFRRGLVLPILLPAGVARPGRGRADANMPAILRHPPQVSSVRFIRSGSPLPVNANVADGSGTVGRSPALTGGSTIRGGR
jgi:hypothetical protein